MPFTFAVRVAVISSFTFCGRMPEQTNLVLPSSSTVPSTVSIFVPTAKVIFASVALSRVAKKLTSRLFFRVTLAPLM